MDRFENGRAVRLYSCHAKYLVAMEDKESVTQDRNESDSRAIWTIELNTSNNNIRLKSCYDMYLTASTESFNLDEIGRKVIQSLPSPDSSMEWKPIRDGDKLKFQTESGSCLRASGGIPPWRNMITHKVPRRSPINEGYLWHVDFLETKVHNKPTSRPGPGRTPVAPTMNPRNIKDAATTAGAMVGEGGVMSGMFTAIQSEIGEKKAHEEEIAATPVASKMNPRNIKDAATTAGAMVGEGGALSGIFTAIQSEIGENKAHEEENAATPVAPKMNPRIIKDAGTTAGAMVGEGGAMSGMFTAIQSEIGQKKAHEEENAATPVARKMNPRNIKDAATTAGAMVGEGGAISGMVTTTQSKIDEKKAHEEENAANKKAAEVADDEGEQVTGAADDGGDQAAGAADDGGDQAAVDEDY